MNSGAAGFHQLFWLILTAFVVALAARRLRAPYSLALVITGIAIGISRLLPKVHLDPEVLMTVFLPPLLFESALNLHLNLLKRDWVPIAIYTLFGTISSTVIIGLAVTRLLHLPMAISLVFGALISTTDPISVIAVFRKLGADRRLKLIMEAESLFNDSLAVVIFTVVLGIAAGGRFSYVSSIGHFVQLALGGALLGTAIGLLASRVHYELNDHLIEITLTTVVAFGSYLVADRIGVSGVMAVVAAGVTMGSYGMETSMSPGTRLAISAFWEYLAFVVNSIVFLLIGIEVAYIDWRHRVWLACAASVVVLVGRAAIYPISLLVNKLHGNIPRSWQHVLVWGGLRGALSMALVLGLPQQFPYRDTMVAATFGVVLFSLLVQGSTVGVLLRRLGLANIDAAASPRQRQLETELIAVHGGLAEIERLRAAEAHPVWALHHLFAEYLERERQIYATLEEIQPNYASKVGRMESYARQAALLAEKSALSDAHKQGRIGLSAEWQDTTARIDEELLALQNRETE